MTISWNTTKYLRLLQSIKKMQRTPLFLFLKGKFTRHARITVKNWRSTKNACNRQASYSQYWYFNSAVIGPM